MPELSFALLIIIAFTSTVLSFLFFLYTALSDRRQYKRLSDIELSKTQEKSLAILQEAMNEARRIISKAEEEEKKIIQNNQNQQQRLEQLAETEIHQSTKLAADQFTAQIKAASSEVNKANQAYFDYLKFIHSQIEQSKGDNEQLIKAQINELFEKVDTNLSHFLADTQQHSLTAIDLELRATRNLIDTYKQQQLKIVDENIIAILERTTSLILSKKLSFNDQEDLIFESLERAKVEKFIA